MALLSKNKTLSGLLTKGTVGEIAMNTGVGAVINFADNKTGSHLKGVNLSLGRTVNGQPLSLNLTDLVQVLATTGLNLSGKGLITTFLALGVKKLAEAFGVIMDDPLPSATKWPQLDLYRKQQQPQAPMIMERTFGGNYA